MKFLIPRAESRAEAEEFWGLLRETLFEIGLPTTRRRIQALALGRDGDWTFLEVDMETPDGDTVLAIFEARNAELFEACPERSRRACPERSRRICTPRQVVEGDVPHALGLAEGAPVIDFDAGVVGHA